MNDDPRIDPADLRNVRFPGSSRRYDARAVEQFLESVAARIEATNTLVDELRKELFEVRESSPEAPPPSTSELSMLDDDDLVRLVGEETASVLSTARRAAEGIRSKAEESAARVIREATSEADRLTEEAKARAVELTADAEEAMERATTAAEAEAKRIREEAEQEAEALTTETRQKVESEQAALEARRTEVEAEADQVLEDAREEGRSMLAEAKEVRHRILEDLQRRRDMAREQIERLLAGRERLLAAYELVRENLDDITGQLADSLPDPRDTPEPELPDGFVGIVGVDADSEGAEAERDEAAEAAEAGEAGEAEVDDTVAPAADDAPEPDGADEDESAAGAEDAVSSDDDAEPALDEQADDGDREKTEATSEEDGEGQDAGDVDALFARLRAEREQSVAKAQQVLDADDEVADTSDTDAQAEDADTSDTDADAQAEVDEAPAGADDAVETDDAAASGGGDVDHVPVEFLADAEALERRSAALGPLGGKLNRALKRQLADEQNQLLDLLRRSGSTAADELLPAAEEQVATYARVATKHLQAAAEAGASEVGGDTDVDVSELAQVLGATLVEPFRRRVERSASEVDGDADELDERLRALYREWKAQHIGPATEDALLSAYALGTLRAVEPDGQVRWCIDPQQGPCPDAQDNALAGAVAAGEAFPTGDTCPQAHPGCRCLLVAN